MKNLGPISQRVLIAVGLLLGLIVLPAACSKDAARETTESSLPSQVSTDVFG